MKNTVYIIAAFVVGGFLLQAGQAKGQSTGQKEKKEKEALIAIEKAYAEEAEAQVHYRKARNLYRIQERDGDFLVAPAPPVEPFIYGVGMSEKSFNLSLRKNFMGETIAKKTTFTVDDDQKKLRISVKGSCMEGTISVKFSLPSGKAFNQIEIDSSADIDWSQSISVDESHSYKGQWNVEVKATKAKGMYSVSISSY